MSAESNDDAKNFARSLTDRLDAAEATSGPVNGSSAPPPPPLPLSPSQTATLESNGRKMTGVRFNEMVERIDIEVDPDVERVVDEEANDRTAERL